MDSKTGLGLDSACQRWLRARERFRHEGGTDALEEFAQSENALLASFASDWSGHQEMLVRAYQQFREVLSESGNGAIRH